MSGTKAPDILGMSDEKFMELNGPPVVESTGDDQKSDNQNQLEQDQGQGSKQDEQHQDDDGKDDDSGKSGKGEGAGQGGQDDDDDQGRGQQSEDGKDNSQNQGEGDTLSGEGKDGKKDEGQASGVKPDSKNQGKQEGEQDQSRKDDKTGDQNQDGQATPPDYKALYEKVMAPLKANGKTIELKSPEELVQLAQMGANYTRKMQAIAPHRKILTMLENNGLLDEGKLSFYIDLEKKNPEAIKKLLKDSGINPMDIDTDAPSTYLEGNHKVSDEEVLFKTTLDDLASTPEGKTTLQTINTSWDQASKEVLWKQPEVMTLIHQQRENGIYDRITTEMDRQRALGTLPANVSFLQAYKAIGDTLAQAGVFDDLAKATETVKPPAQKVGQTVQKPKPAAVNGDKVNAASPARSTARQAQTQVNPLSLPDDAFMKEVDKFEGRL